MSALKVGPHLAGATRHQGAMQRRRLARHVSDHNKPVWCLPTAKHYPLRRDKSLLGGSGDFPETSASRVTFTTGELASLKRVRDFYRAVLATVHKTC
jgi:hypothetical protein